MSYNSILVATSGSQGVVLLRELFALGYFKELSIITFPSRFNEPFTTFCDFNRLNFIEIKNSEQLREYFENKSFEILLSVSFRFIFPTNCLDKVRVASINLHPGLLPSYKGSFSIPWAIINNEKYVGYTFHFMDEKVDNGAIILQEKIEIRNRCAHQLNYLVFQKALKNIYKVFDRIKSGKYQDVTNVKGAKFYKNQLPYNGEINTEWSIDRIERFIRAIYFPPFEPAYIVDGDVKIYFEDIKEYLKYLKEKR